MPSREARSSLLRKIADLEARNAALESERVASQETIQALRTNLAIEDERNGILQENCEKLGLKNRELETKVDELKARIEAQGIQ